MEDESVRSLNTDQVESLKSLQSTIRKLESALSQMTQSGANTTLVKKRLHAVCTGLAVLEHVWGQKGNFHPYTPEDLTEARTVLIGLTTSVENSYVKSKAGSPQRTLLERRLLALKLAVQAMEELLAD
ncbi:hypothetical protein NST84_19135 [Paenibacillus sp. FSL R7-0345]|uniref:hypothetical protein n=1 Tax=Paenibacillus sp. FSL R7-0345 TaxID=2954535 RepID=UPI00315A14BB